MREVHKDCPTSGCGICQNWPCAKLAAQEYQERQQAQDSADEAKIRRIVCEELAKIGPSEPAKGAPKREI